MKEELIKVLKAAREKVRKGWIQNRAQNQSGTQVCSAQAISLTAVEMFGYEEFKLNQMNEMANDWLLTGALDYTGRAWTSVPNWNDYEGRTQDEVVETFDRTIKLAERDLPA